MMSGSHGGAVSGTGTTPGAAAVAGVPPPTLLPLPADPTLVQHVLQELKSQGVFDQYRKECISDVDTKPAYQNLKQRVESSVTAFLSLQTWSADLNKNQLREKLRKHILDSNFLDQGVERIVDQVVNPKIASVFIPLVEEIVYKCLGLEKPEKTTNNSNGVHDNDTPKSETKDNLSHNDLEAVSPDSVKSAENKCVDVSLGDQKFTINNDAKNVNNTKQNTQQPNVEYEDSENSNEEEFESPAFEPLETNIKGEGNSRDSQLSDSAKPDKICKEHNSNSQLSHVSSDSSVSGNANESFKKSHVKTDFKNSFGNPKDNESNSNSQSETMEIVESSSNPCYKFNNDDNASDARQYFEESIKNNLENNTEETINNSNVNMEDVECKNKPINDSTVQSLSKSSDNIKNLGNSEMSVDSTESNSVFTPNTKMESDIDEKEVYSFENKIQPLHNKNTDTSESSDNQLKTDNLKKYDSFEDSSITVKSPASDGKSKESESKRLHSAKSDSISQKSSKEKEKHSSHSRSKDKDKKDDSKYTSKSSHSRHDSRGRHHSSSHEKRDSSSSKIQSKDSTNRDSTAEAKNKDKHSKNNGDSRRDSTKDKYSVNHKSSTSHKNSHSTKEKSYRDSKDSDKNRDSNRSSSKSSGSKEYRESSSSKHSNSSRSDNKSTSKDKSKHSEKNSKSSHSNDEKKHDRKNKSKSNREECSTYKNNRTRRSTDRDSNDGSSGTLKGSSVNLSNINIQSSQKNKSSSNDNSSNGTCSGQSDNVSTDHVNITAGTYIKSEFNMFQFGSMGAIKRQSLAEKPSLVKSPPSRFPEKSPQPSSPDKVSPDKNIDKSSIIMSEKSVTLKCDKLPILKPGESSPKSPKKALSNKLSDTSAIERSELTFSDKYAEMPCKKPIIHIDNQLKPVKIDDTLCITNTEVIKKPKCASNIYEAYRLMKVRKKIQILEREKRHEAILKMEKENNVSQNSSRVYSDASGPELEFICMQPSTQNDSNSKKQSIDGDLKFFNNKCTVKLTHKIDQLHKIIRKLEADLGIKSTLDTTVNNFKPKNGFVHKKLGIKNTIKYKAQKPITDNKIDVLSPIGKIKYMDELSSVVKKSSDDNIIHNDKKNGKIFNKSECDTDSEILTEILEKEKEKSEKDILEVILGSQVQFDVKMIFSENGSSFTNIAKYYNSSDSVMRKRKRISTSSSSGNEKVSNDNSQKLNHNNNLEETANKSGKKRKTIKENERDATSPDSDTSIENHINENIKNTIIPNKNHIDSEPIIVKELNERNTIIKDKISVKINTNIKINEYDKDTNMSKKKLFLSRFN